jgi:mitochondrial fission protein ELM1
MSEFLAQAPVIQPASRLLAGRRAWIISDGVAGHLAITRGIAETLGLVVDVKAVDPGFPWRHLAPNGPAAPSQLNALLAEPLPELVLGAGRQTVPFVRALRRAGKGRVFTVLFQSPRAGVNSAHLIWVPSHDGLRGPNVITTLTPPHRFTAAALAGLRAHTPAEIAALPAPRIALLLGGPGAGYSYGKETLWRFHATLLDIVAVAGSLLISTSRRTPSELLSLVDEESQAVPRILWAGQGPNPYPNFLAHADFFIVTADSVNMTGEAAATGKPVYIFAPFGGRSKFHRFHAALEACGATRPLPEPLTALEAWDYEPLASAEQVAAEIEARWQTFQSTTSSP